MIGIFRAPLAVGAALHRCGHRLGLIPRQDRPRRLPVNGHPRPRLERPTGSVGADTASAVAHPVQRHQTPPPSRPLSKVPRTPPATSCRRGRAQQRPNRRFPARVSGFFAFGSGRRQPYSRKRTRQKTQDTAALGQQLPTSTHAPTHSRIDNDYLSFNGGSSDRCSRVARTTDQITAQMTRNTRVARPRVSTECVLGWYKSVDDDSDPPLPSPEVPHGACSTPSAKAVR